MSNRPDWIKCVGHSHLDRQGTSWCGRGIRHEWAFLGPDHAANNGFGRGRLVACPACVDAICAALRNGHEDIPTEGRDGS